MTAAAILVSVPILAGSFTYMWWNTKRQMDIAVEKAQISKILHKNMFRVPGKAFHILLPFL